MRAILLFLASIAFSFALSLSPLLFHSLPRSFALSHTFSFALSLSPSFFHFLLRSFALSLTLLLSPSLFRSLSRSCKQRRSLAPLASEVAVRHENMRSTMTLIIMMTITTTFLKVNLLKLELCIAISPLLGHVEEK